MKQDSIGTSLKFYVIVNSKTTLHSNVQWS